MATAPLAPPSGSEERPRVARAAAAVALVLGLLTAVAILLPPQFDEVTYYVPALTAVRAQPPPPLREVPFPSPPVALWLQAALWDALGRSLLAARLFSLLAWALLAALPAWRPARGGPVGSPYGYAFTIGFPFVLFAATVSKHHVFALLLVSIAITAHANARRGAPGLVAASLAACALATGTSQFAGPLCLVLAIDALVRRRADVGVLPRLAGPLLGLLVLAAFVVAWGGTSPPSFVDVPAFHDRGEALRASGFRWRPQQLALGLTTLGVWATPWTGVTRRGLWTAIACLLPAVLLVATSGVLADSSVPSEGGRGPVCTAARWASAVGPSFLGPALFAAFAALGAAGVLDRALRPGPGRLHALYVTIYLATMMAVPFAFESYYTLMVLPACHLLGPPEEASRAGAFAGVVRWWVPAGGVAYLLAKAAQTALAR